MKRYPLSTDAHAMLEMAMIEFCAKSEVGLKVCAEVEGPDAAADEHSETFAQGRMLATANGLLEVVRECAAIYVSFDVEVMSLSDAGLARLLQAILDPSGRTERRMTVTRIFLGFPLWWWLVVIVGAQIGVLLRRRFTRRRSK